MHRFTKIFLSGVLLITLIIGCSVTSSAHEEGLAYIRNGLSSEYIEPVIIEKLGPPSYRYDLTAEDEELLCRIAYSEAGNQGVYGQALIMAVVMNRVESSRFPNSVHDVIFAPSQFSISHWFYETPVDQMRPALELLQSGGVDDRGALFFCTTSFRNLTYVFSYGAHNFYI